MYHGVYHGVYPGVYHGVYYGVHRGEYPGVQVEDSIFIQVFNPPLGVAHYSNIINDRN